MDRKYELAIGYICLAVAILCLALMYGINVDVAYSGSMTTSFGTVHFVEDVEDHCGDNTCACIYPDNTTYLMDEVSPVEQYVFCSHEKMHAVHPDAEHGTTPYENVFFANTVGVHPSCARLALNYH